VAARRSDPGRLRLPSAHRRAGGGLAPRVRRPGGAGPAARPSPGAAARPDPGRSARRELRLVPAFLQSALLRQGGGRLPGRWVAHERRAGGLPRRHRGQPGGGRHGHHLRRGGLAPRQAGLGGAAAPARSEDPPARLGDLAQRPRPPHRALAPGGGRRDVPGAGRLRGSSTGVMLASAGSSGLPPPEAPRPTRTIEPAATPPPEAPPPSSEPVQPLEPLPVAEPPPPPPDPQAPADLTAPPADAERSP